MALAVEGRDGRLRLSVGRHLDEGEAARTARLAIHDDVDVGDFTVRREQRPDVVFRRLEGKVAAVDPLTHGRSNRSRPYEETPRGRRPLGSRRRREILPNGGTPLGTWGRRRRTGRGRKSETRGGPSGPSIQARRTSSNSSPVHFREPEDSRTRDPDVATTNPDAHAYPEAEVGQAGRISPQTGLQRGQIPRGGAKDTCYQQASDPAPRPPGAPLTRSL